MYVEWIGLSKFLRFSGLTADDSADMETTLEQVQQQQLSLESDLQALKVLAGLRVTS